MWALQVVKLKSFVKFDNTTEALAAATHVVDSKLGKGLRLACVLTSSTTALPLLVGRYVVTRYQSNASL